jgi:hypothetical protein
MNRFRDVLIVALCACVGLSIALTLVMTGSLDGKLGRDEASISQLQGDNQRLQGENQQLTTEVTSDHATLVKIPSQAGTGQLGLCYSTTSETFSNLYDSVMDGYPFTIGVLVSSPTIINGVVSCPSGEQFVPITPEKQ